MVATHKMCSYSLEITSVLCSCCAKALVWLSLAANDGKLVMIYYRVCPLWSLALSGALVAQNGALHGWPTEQNTPGRHVCETSPGQCHSGRATCPKLFLLVCWHVASVGFPLGRRKWEMERYLPELAGVKAPFTSCNEWGKFALGK